MTILKEKEYSLSLDFVEVFGVMTTYLRAMKKNENNANLHNIFKKAFEEYIENALNENVAYSKSLFTAFFDYLRIDQTTPNEKDILHVQADYWIALLRLILLFSLNASHDDQIVTEKLETTCSEMLPRIWEGQSAINFHFLICQAVFSASPARIKSIVMNVFVEEALKRVDSGDVSPQTVLTILTLNYAFVCRRNNEFENLLRDVVFFGAKTSEFLDPLNIGQLVSMISIKKTFLKDIQVPDWIQSEARAKSAQLASKIYQKFIENPAVYLTNSNVLALLLHQSGFAGSIDPQQPISPLIKDFEDLKKQLTKQAKPEDIRENAAEILQMFEGFLLFDNYSKAQYLVSAFLKLIALNSQFNPKGPALFQPMHTEAEVNTNTNIWHELINLLGKINEFLAGLIRDFVSNILSFSTVFENVNEEAKETLHHLFLNAYYFSVYSSFQITPHHLGIKKDEGAKNLVNFLVNSTAIQEKMESILSEFYTLYSSKETQTFFLKITTFCFAPLSSFQQPVSANSQLNQCLNLVKDILLLSALKGESLKLFSLLTKKLRDDYKSSIPEDSLQSVFVQNVEDFFFSKQINYDEVIGTFQLFPFEASVENRKLYLRLFVETKKFLNIVQGFLTYNKAKSSNLLNKDQLLKIEKLLINILNDTLKNEITNPYSKAAFLLLLALSKQNVKLGESLSTTYLEWTYKALNLSFLEKTELFRSILSFILSVERPLPSIQAIIARGVEFKKNIVIPYLINKSPILLLELLTVLQAPHTAKEEPSHKEDKKDSEHPSPAEGKEKKQADITTLLTKKVQKKGSSSKSKKRVDSSKKKEEKEDSIIKEEEGFKIQDLASTIFDDIAADLINFLSDKDGISMFEKIGRASCRERV